MCLAGHSCDCGTLNRELCLSVFVYIRMMVALLRTESFSVSVGIAVVVHAQRKKQQCTVGICVSVSMIIAERRA